MESSFGLRLYENIIPSTLHGLKAEDCLSLSKGQSQRGEKTGQTPETLTNQQLDAKLAAASCAIKNGDISPSEKARYREQSG